MIAKYPEKYAFSSICNYHEIPHIFFLFKNNLYNYFLTQTHHIELHESHNQAINQANNFVCFCCISGSLSCAVSLQASTKNVSVFLLLTFQDEKTFMVTWRTGTTESIKFSFFCKLANILNKNWVPDDCSATNWGTNFCMIYWKVFGAPCQPGFLIRYSWVIRNV